MTIPSLSSYEDGLRYLLGLTKLGVKPGLTRVRRAFQLLGHPERRLPSVVVGGTNGKGSVATLVARTLSKQGYRTGLFTSPHLHRLTERIRIDGREVGRRRLVRALQAVADVSEPAGGPRLTFFETLTVAAGLIFLEEAVDVAVLEVGLGGRLDATKVFPASAVAITSIGLDHQQFLGDTIESVAAEKFALTRRGAIVVTGALQPSLRPMIVERARITRSPLWMAGREFSWTIEEGSPSRLSYSGPFGRLENLELPLSGAHQAHNQAVAITLLAALRRRSFDVGEDALRSGLHGFTWPARGEKCLSGRVVLDVAHNPAGSRALAAQLPDLSSGREPIVIVFGCMRDKDVEGIARPLRSGADHFLLAAPRMPRALPVDEFPAWLEGHPHSSVERAVDAALKIAGDDGLVVVTGSTFVIAEARAHLLGIKDLDPSIPM